MMSTPVKTDRRPTNSRAWLSLAVIALILLGLACFGDKGIYRLVQLRQQKAALEQELARLKVEGTELQREIVALKSDYDHIERVARQELGMVKADELVYQFPEQ